MAGPENPPCDCTAYCGDDPAIARGTAGTCERYDAIHAPSSFDLAAHLRRQIEFSAQTFGPGDLTDRVCDHIRIELAEVKTAAASGVPTLAEWVDVIILGFDGAWRSGATPAEIVAAIQAKQTLNEGRRWPDWRTADPLRAIEHIRDGDR